MRNTKYTYGLGKGCGLVEETLSLLSICDENTTKESLAQMVHEQNYLGKSTAQRNEDIVKLVFYPRFMLRNPKVVLWLKCIREKGLMLQQFKQLLMLYCARENAIFYDYLIGEFIDLKATQITRLPDDNIVNYIQNLVNTGKISWSESTIKRSKSNIKACLIDFDMLNRKGDILPYHIYNFTTLYLMHELHFEGFSDAAMWNHEDWKLFGMDKTQVRDAILEQNIKGGYIAQCTGDLMTISWNYKTMEDFINGTL